jgi:hypothetical protein
MLMSAKNERSPLVVNEVSSTTIATINEEEKILIGSKHLPRKRWSDHRFLVMFALNILGFLSFIKIANCYNNEALDFDMKVSKSKWSLWFYQDGKEEVASRDLLEDLVRPSFEAELYYHPTKDEKKKSVRKSSTSRSMENSQKPMPPPPLGCTATVILIRHCEKGVIREHCNALGFERAQYIASLFGDDKDARWPAPSYLYALAPGERHNKKVHNWREVETIQPLSDKIGVPIDTSFGMANRKDFSKHIFHLLRTGEMCGKVALVSWKHDDIPHLSRSLGCGKKDGCPKTWARSDDFDSTWQILYSYHKQLYPSFLTEEKENQNKDWGAHPQWWISGHVIKEGFDPLQFMKKSGSR